MRVRENFDGIMGRQKGRSRRSGKICSAKHSAAAVLIRCEPEQNSARLDVEIGADVVFREFANVAPRTAEQSAYDFCIVLTQRGRGHL